jgi:tRNA 2-(methylsulfanyl)-N6-isopentenyladenosine37 hydroxylase
MLRLKTETDPRWADLANQDLEEILTDHAFCEQKAASTAISLIVKYPDYPELVTEMSALAREEMEHFQRVHEIILKRGYSLGRERKDEYVNELLSFVRKDASRIVNLVEKLLFSAMIEARSCERFRVLSENIEDKELSEFYRELMASEAGHYTLFLTLARKYGNPEGVDVDKRWHEFLAFEAELIKRYESRARIHG